MKKIIENIFKIIVVTLLSISALSCSKEDVDINNLNDTFFVRHKNADMPAHIYGNGSEKVFLIILHGGPGDNGLGYRVNTIRTEIEKNNAVVYFDQRGSGSSQGNYSEDDLSIDVMAEDVLALVKVIKSKYGNDSRFFLMGHSWGGTLGTATLLKDQSEFKGWIEVDGAHNFAGLYDDYKMILPQTANEQIALGNSVDYWKNVIKEVQSISSNYSIDNNIKLNTIANTVDPVLAKDGIINDEIIDLGDDVQRPNIYMGLWNLNRIGKIFDYQKGLNQISFTDRLSEITIPSLVLWGKYDHTVSLKFGYEAFDNLGSTDKELFIFDRSGHAPMNTEPNLFADRVIKFINKHK